MSEIRKAPENVVEVNDFVDTLSDLIENMSPNEQRETLVPSSIEFSQFVCACGKLERSYEIGGVFNPDTRSLIFTRGFGANDQHAFSNPNVKFVAPRRNEADESTDEFWHTHPWSETKSPSYLSPSFSSAKTKCLPSDQDNSALLGIWSIEYEEGHKRTVTSTIGCGGYVSITTLHGISLDEGELRTMGITEKQLREVKALLALGPPIWLGNLATQGNGEELWRLVEQHYAKKHKQDGSFSKDLDQLIKQASPLLRHDQPRGKPTAEEGLRTTLLQHLPQFFQRHRLTNVGISPVIAETVMDMVGIVTKIKEFPQIT